MSNASTSRKRRTNLTLDAGLVEEARVLGVNLSQACEAGLTQQVRSARAAAWLEENRAALESSNAWVEKHGLPLARHRMF